MFALTQSLPTTAGPPTGARTIRRSKTALTVGRRAADPDLIMELVAQPQPLRPQMFVTFVIMDSICGT